MSVATYSIFSRNNVTFLFKFIQNIEDDIDFGGEGKTSLTRKQAKITDIINLYEKPTEFFAAERSFGSDKNPGDGQANDPSDTLVALKAWPLFLESEEYHKWKRDRRKTVIRFRENLEDIIEQDPMSDDESDTTADVKAIPSIESIDLEFSRISKDQLWLTELLSSVEFLPLCVSVASARKGEKGFPLIYVNKFFETTTGYSREQILGQNCKFLQKGPNPGQVAQPSSVARMRSNLHDGKPVKVVVTNYRKDGSPFMNLLALKPIFDSNGEYAFVVGIQFDIGDGNASPERLQMVEKIMGALPDQLAPNVESTKDTNV